MYVCQGEEPERKKKTLTAFRPQNLLKTEEPASGGWVAYRANPWSKHTLNLAVAYKVSDFRALED